MIHRKEVSARAKYTVIHSYRKQYPVLVMCQFFAVSESGYYGFVNRMSLPEKDAVLAEMIRQQQDKCLHTYGYRRMWHWLERNAGIHRNPKTILAMKNYGLLTEIRRRRKGVYKWLIMKLYSQAVIRI